MCQQCIRWVNILLVKSIVRISLPSLRQNLIYMSVYYHLFSLRATTLVIVLLRNVYLSTAQTKWINQNPFSNSRATHKTTKNSIKIYFLRWKIVGSFFRISLKIFLIPFPCELILKKWITRWSMKRICNKFNQPFIWHA